MEIPVLMLADDAVAFGGKLYIHGGGWDRINSAQFPISVPRLALVMTLRLDYDEALTDHRVTVDLVDEDDEPVPGVQFVGNVRIGHPPEIRRGDATLVSQTFTIEGLPLDRPGGYRFRVFVGDSLDVPLGVCRFVLAGPPASGAPAPN